MGKRSEIAPGVHWLLGGVVNSYAVEYASGSGWRLVLLDCGLPAEAGLLWRRIRSLGYGPEDVTDILVTHHHVDHVGGLAQLARWTGARVHAHPADADIIRHATPRPPADPSTWAGRALSNRIPPPAPRAPVHTAFADGQRLSLAGGIQVLHTPGHTLGHCAFLLERDGGTVFTGDAVLRVADRITVPIPLALNEDRAAVLDSVARLARLQCTAAAFGTGGPIRDHASERLRAAAERLARKCGLPPPETC